MKRAFCALALLFAVTTGAGADERSAEQLDAFIVDACEYLSENRHISAESAYPHFGKLRKREWVTKQVDEPHARFHIDATRLRGWPVSLEYNVHFSITVPHGVRITVGELEQLLGS